MNLFKFQPFLFDVTDGFSEAVFPVDVKLVDKATDDRSVVLYDSKKACHASPQLSSTGHHDTRSSAICHPYFWHSLLT